MIFLRLPLPSMQTLGVTPGVLPSRLPGGFPGLWHRAEFNDGRLDASEGIADVDEMRCRSVR